VVIADTSTWTPFFTDPGSPEKRAIAALALQHRCQVYALDPHFREIPGLALYRPKSGISR